MIRRLFSHALRAREELGRFVLTLLVYASILVACLLGATLLLGFGIVGAVAAAVFFLVAAFGLLGACITIFTFLRVEPEA